jgi:hypothetical protein
VRSAAGLVCQIGVIQPAAMRSFLKLYHNYIKEEKFDGGFGNSKLWQDYIVSNPSYAIVEGKDVAVKVIGVWDTVGALGVPDMGHLVRRDNSRYRKAYQFHDVELNDSTSPAARQAGSLGSMTRKHADVGIARHSVRVPGSRPG